MSQTEYARLAALVRLRLEELREALDLHEENQRWEQAAVIEHVECGLAQLVEEVQRS